MTKLMTAALAAACLAAACLAGAAPAAATTITFDDLATSANGAAIANGYAGFTWSNFYELNPSLFLSKSGYAAGRASPSNVAFNGYAGLAGISSAAPFTLNSGLFTSAYDDRLTIAVTGFVGGVQAYATSFVVGTAAPALETFGWTGLTSVTFASLNGTAHPGLNAGSQFVLDNLVVNETVAGAVPEPAAWATMILGLGMIGLLARRRRAAGTVRFA